MAQIEQEQDRAPVRSTLKRLATGGLYAALGLIALGMGVLTANIPDVFAGCNLPGVGIVGISLSSYQLTVSEGGTISSTVVLSGPANSSVPVSLSAFKVSTAGTITSSGSISVTPSSGSLTLSSTGAGYLNYEIKGLSKSSRMRDTKVVATVVGGKPIVDCQAIQEVTVTCNCDSRTQIRDERPRSYRGGTMPSPPTSATEWASDRVNDQCGHWTILESNGSYVRQSVDGGLVGHCPYPSSRWKAVYWLSEDGCLLMATKFCVWEGVTDRYGNVVPGGSDKDGDGLHDGKKETWNLGWTPPNSRDCFHSPEPSFDPADETPRPCNNAYDSYAPDDPFNPPSPP